MTGKSLWILWAVLQVFIFTQVAFAQDNNTSVRWYVDAQPEEWIVHNNIVGFVSEPGKMISEPSELVDKTEITGAGKNLLVVHFRNGVSGESKSAYIENLKKKGISRQLIAVSKPAHSGSPVHNKLLLVDEQVIVTFKESPSLAYLETFAEKYNLEPVSNRANDLNEIVFVFRYRNFSISDNSATISSRIFDRESSKVRSVHPNRVNLFEPQSTNDTYIDLAWHVENNGQQVSCSTLQGEHEADAHITGAWNLGYTGQGVKVGVIDFYGFDFNHPDMQGQMLPGWDCINNASYDGTNFYFTDPSQAHGMAVCGVIGANANNGTGSAGVAYGAKIVPFLIDGSESSVVLAMQKARSAQFDVDVVNCSFGSYFPSPAIQAEIQNLVNHGRARNGNTYGVVVVTSHGNDNYSDIENPQYPAAYDEVISVGSSTPDDRRKSPDDAWNTAGAWGTNYGALLDLTAPGVCIFTTDLSGSDGYSTSDYVAFQKTSASTPIVSGVAALMLSKNPNMSWEDVRNRLSESADKTNNSANGGSYNYSYDQYKPGHSMEMGYGRVNAEKAVSDEAVGTGDAGLTQLSARFAVTPFVTNMLDIHYAIDADNRPYEMTIIDMSGRLLLNAVLPAGYGSMNLDVSNLSPGMYFVKCSNGFAVVSSEKFVKVR